jgi:hypothetical protein
MRAVAVVVALLQELAARAVRVVVVLLVVVALL